MPDFICNYRDVPRPFVHSWEDTVGSGHAPLGLRSDWQEQLLRCHRQLGFQRVRFHDLLSDDIGTLMCENDKPLYSFFNADQIADYILSIGMRPFIELSFMPSMLASGNTTVFHYNANVTPPKDYAGWSTLIQKLVTHWVDRYGIHELRKWRFEVWNEPNMKSFWTGTQQDYFQLYRVTATAIKAVDSLLHVGGPATAKNAWIPEFLDFCRNASLPVDFVSTHHYPTDAFGKPGADTLTQLEHAPRGVMREQTRRARAEVGNLPLYYTEWNISSNPRDPLHDEPFAAPFIVKVAMEAQEFVQAYSFWTFSDIFEENYFPSVPFQGGFGLINLYGVAKPAYRGFELMHELGDESLPLTGSHDTVDARVVRKPNSATVLLTNSAMPRHPIHTEMTGVRIRNAPEPRSAYIRRIDEDHVNPRRLWKAMGEPKYLSSLEVSQLETQSSLVNESQLLTCEEGDIAFAVALPPQSVAAITLEFS